MAVKLLAMVRRSSGLMRQANATQSCAMQGHLAGTTHLCEGRDARRDAALELLLRQCARDPKLLHSIDTTATLHMPLCQSLDGHVGPDLQAGAVTCSVSPPIMAASSRPSGCSAILAWLSAPCTQQCRQQINASPRRSLRSCFVGLLSSRWYAECCRADNSRGEIELQQL